LLAYRQTDRQTKSGKNITSLVEVITKGGQNDIYPSNAGYPLLQSILRRTILHPQHKKANKTKKERKRKEKQNKEAKK